MPVIIFTKSLQWRNNGHDGFSNHQPNYCLLNRLFRCISKKILKLRITGLCERNSLVTGEFPAQRASNAENSSIWWHHHVLEESSQGWGLLKLHSLISLLWKFSILQKQKLESLIHIHIWQMSMLNSTHCGPVTPYDDRSGSTLAQVMACCVTAPSHYLKQC